MRPLDNFVRSSAFSPWGNINAPRPRGPRRGLCGQVSLQPDSTRAAHPIASASEDGHASPRRALSPKLGREPGRHYAYYAGFAEKFVEREVLRLPPTATRVLDPWSGSGTTGVVCARHELNGFGVDANPAMVAVARSRMIDPDWARIGKSIPTSWSADSQRTTVLRTWLTEEAAARLRGFERQVMRNLLGRDAPFIYDLALDSSAEASDAQIYTAALFVASLTKRILSGFGTSNPTWIRLKVPTRAKLSLTPADLVREARATLANCATAHRNAPASGGLAAANRVVVGDSCNLPFASGAFDAVITSPPYCTRLDYVVATLPELAIFGIQHVDAVRQLRQQMIGSPTPAPEALAAVSDALLPLPVLKFLNEVSRHDSKAASTYYLNFFADYYGRLWKSFREVSRVLRPGGRLCVVVQDSHFKDILVPVTDHLRECLPAIGLKCVETTRRAVPNPIACNPHGRSYRTSNATAESVLLFERD